jgi:hypothetical protein
MDGSNPERTIFERPRKSWNERQRLHGSHDVFLPPAMERLMALTTFGGSPGGKTDMTHARSSTVALLIVLAGLLPAAADSVPVPTQGGSTAADKAAPSSSSAGVRASAGDNGTTLLGLDLSGAGTTPDSNKAFFRAQDPDRQAQIRKRCDDVMNTGSVANTDQPGGSSASTEGAAPKAGGITTPSTVGANILSFCTNIK